MKDFYKILEIDQRATLQDVRKKFKEKAFLIHPDKSGQNTKEQFVELYEAYEILSNKKRRAQYDKIYDWIKIPSDDVKSEELTKALILIHARGVDYADNFDKFDKEVIKLVFLNLLLPTDKLGIAALAATLIGLWTVGKGLINLQFDYSLVGLTLTMLGLWLGKIKLDNIRKEAKR